MRHYAVQEDYFARIDTVDKAYILGIFASDGCIKGGGQVQFCQKDRDLVHFIRRSFGAEQYPIRDPHASCSDLCSLRITRQRMVHDLQALGFTRRKSSNDTPFPDIPTHLRRAYVLGFFDGNGCISSARQRDRPSRLWHVSIAGTPLMVAGIRAVMAEECGFSPEQRIYHRVSLCYELLYGGNQQVNRIGRWLYAEPAPSFFLRRKRDKFAEVAAIPPYVWSRPRKTHCVHGHPFGEPNPQAHHGWQQRCSICRSEARRKKKAALLAAKNS